MAFVFVSICFLMVLRFTFSAIGSELMSYAVYMGTRALKVNIGADVQKIVSDVVPWVPKERIVYGQDDQFRWVGVSDSVTGALTKMVVEPDVRMECEDNPLWYVAGSEECP